MVDSLRPLSTTELLLKTFGLYRQNFVLLVGASLAGPILFFLYRIALIARGIAVRKAPWDANPGSVIALATAVTILMVAGLPLSSAAAVKAVAAVTEGRALRATEAYRAVGRRWWSVFGIALSLFVRAALSAVLFIVMGALALALSASLGYNGGREAAAVGYACGGTALLAAAIAWTRVYMRYSVSVQACLTEEIRGRLALKRSMSLTEGGRGRVAAVYGVSMILLFAIVLGAEVFRIKLHNQGIALKLLEALATLIAGALTAPLVTIGSSLVYQDAHAREETFVQNVNCPTFANCREM